jgi:phage tail sheath protein FI
MPMNQPPGVYVAETAATLSAITGVSTSTAGLVGVTERGPGEPLPITCFAEFTQRFGAAPEPSRQLRERWVRDRNEGGQWWQLPLAVKGFFDNGGERLYVSRVTRDHLNELTASDFVSAIEALRDIDEISLLLAPGVWSASVHAALIGQCEATRQCFALLDPPNGLDPDQIRDFRGRLDSGFAALYYPWLEVDAAGSGQALELAPAAHVAGVYARVDRERGVHKAPAGEAIRGITAIARTITAAQAERLGQAGINPLRTFPGRGPLVWGARTLTSDAEWKYVNVRRLFIFLEHSIDEGTQWVVFEPNGELLWARVQQSVAAFLLSLWRQGALPGRTPEEAFFVRCDRTTMTQNDLDQGRFVCLIGVAAVKPAEFVFFRIGQWTADHGESPGSTAKPIPNSS